MPCYVGLDVSLKETAICLVDEHGTIVREGSALTNPDDLAAFLNAGNEGITRIGLEAGNLAAWIVEALRDRGFPIVCMEALHASRMLKAQAIKTDRNDARGLAQIVRCGWYKPVHIKSQASQRLRVLLNNRQLVLSKRKDIENHIRATLRSFGLKMGRVWTGRFDRRVRELLVDRSDLADLVEPLLVVRQALADQQAILTAQARALARRDTVCQLLQSIPGVGPLTSLAFRATIDDPARFRRSRDVGAHLGLVPRKYASGEIDMNGRITRTGDRLTRSYLYEAAQSLMIRCKAETPLRAWGVNLAKRSCRKTALVAVARKLSVIMHRMWVDGTQFDAHHSESAA